MLFYQCITHIAVTGLFNTATFIIRTSWDHKGSDNQGRIKKLKFAYIFHY